MDCPREAESCGEKREDGTIDGGRKKAREEGYVV